MIVEHTLVGDKHPHMTFAIADNRLHPVAGILAGFRVGCNRFRETFGQWIIDIYSTVGTYPHILVLVLI